MSELLPARPWSIGWIKRWVLGKVTLWFARSRSYESFTLADASRPGSPSNALEKLQSALELAKRIDLRQYRQLQRNVSVFMIVDKDALEYVREMRSGVLSRRFVEDQPIATLAATLVAIGARARLKNSKYGHKIDSRWVGRVVRVGSKAQLRFVSKLPSEEFSGLAAYQQYLHGLLLKYGERSNGS